MPRKAFTMIELVFVIAIIGILAAVAIPKLAVTRSDAVITKAKTTFASVRNAIATERQKRILRGKFDKITDLGDTTYAFNKFSAITGETQVRVLEYPVKNCATGEQGCWKRTDGLNYIYVFPVSGEAKFKLDKSRLICADADTTKCDKLTQ